MTSITSPRATASAAPDLAVGVLVGSLRRTSFNRMVAQTLPELAPQGMQISLLPSIGQIPLYDQDLFDQGLPAPVQALAQAIGERRAVVIVTPEYNYSVPGALKNALDWLSRLQPKPLSGKHVLLQSASMGALGGVRGQYHLRQVLVALNAQVMNLPEVLIGNVDRKVDVASGRLVDEASRGFIRQQLNALAAYLQSQRAAL